LICNHQLRVRFLHWAPVFLMLTVPANADVASWYGPGFHGRLTANGERFNRNALTAAHRTLPFGTIVRVTYRGKSVVVRINDRGPFIKGRTIDLSEAAAKKIGCSGVCDVTVTVIKRGKK
jgi:rare lipoprotein A